MNTSFISETEARSTEGRFEMERRKGVIVFAFIFFFACCCFIESHVARLAVDAVASILYWVWVGGFEAPLNYRGNDEVSRYHRAVIRTEKLTTFNSTLLLTMVTLVIMWQIGRWVDGPKMCNPKCHWCKERISEESQPNEQYNPQGRE